MTNTKRARYVAPWLGAMTTMVMLPACGGAEPDDDEDVMTSSSAWTDPNDPSWGCYDPEPGHPTTAEQARFFTDMAPAAQEAERTHGVPAAAILAMAAVEGGYGFTRTGIHAKNLFGYKYSNPTATGGRAAYTLSCQPAWDVGNKYIVFRDLRDGILFVSGKLATRADWANYKAATDRYRSARASGVAVTAAVNAWVDGIADAGYNYDPPTYKRTIKSAIAARSLYSYSASITPGGASGSGGGGGAGGGGASSAWVAIDAPTSSSVSGDVALRVTVGGAVSQVRFYSVTSTGAEYLIGSDSTPPFAVNWSTRPWVSTGQYTLRFEAYNGATKVATATKSVYVAN